MFQTYYDDELSFNNNTEYRHTFVRNLKRTLINAELGCENDFSRLQESILAQLTANIEKLKETHTIPRNQPVLKYSEIVSTNKEGLEVPFAAINKRLGELQALIAK